MQPIAAKLRIVAFVFGAFALLGLAGAAWNIPPTMRLAAGERAEGRLVRFERIGRGSHPVVQYLRAGRPMEFRSKVSGRGDYRVGDSVPVRYDLQDPSLVDVDSFDTLWGSVVIPGVIGLVFGGMAVLVMYLRRRLAA